MAWKGEEKSDFPNEVAVVAGIYCYTSTITAIVPYGKAKKFCLPFSLFRLNTKVELIWDLALKSALDFIFIIIGKYPNENIIKVGMIFSFE